MKKSIVVSICIIMLFVCNTFAQEITLFFPAADFSETPDRFGNVYHVGPSDAILSTPIGDPALEGVFYEEDNLWAIWQFIGNTMLISHAPGYFEDAPELTATIDIATGGKYEVILNFIEDETVPGTGPIQAALGDDDLTLYDANNSNRATGGVGLAYPFGDGTIGSAFWYTVSLGEVEVESGGTIKVRVDDVPGDQFGILAAPEVATVFQGITLRILELGGGLSEIQVSPGAFDWTTDVSGNQFRTWPLDEAAYPTEDDWRTVTTRSDGSGTWNIRAGLGPYGPILESFPQNGNDAMPLQTSVIFADAGTYNVYMSMGDTAGSEPSQNCGEINSLLFGFSADDLKTYIASDGNFKGTPGYNDYEIPVGVITVGAGEQVDFVVDDAIDVEGITRSVYLGMRFEKLQDAVVPEIQISPGVFDWTSDLSGNRYRTTSLDNCLNPEEWITDNITNQGRGDGFWNMRQGLGPYGPILESFPNSSEDAPPLKTSIMFAHAGTYDAFFSIGDTADADPVQNAGEPNPLQFGLEGQDLKTWIPDDGEFKGTPGYNDYEVSLGQFNVSAGEQLDFIIDDVQDFENVQRSVYLGMRLVLVSQTDVEEWSVY